MITLTTTDRRTLSLWLALWAMGSMVIALLAIVVQSSIPIGRTHWFVQSIAAECLVWGLVEVAFAFAGLHAARTAMQSSTSDDASRTINLLRFVMRLDIAILVLDGLLIIYAVSIGHRSSGYPSAILAGHGVGILLQCGFLLLLVRHFIKRFSAHTPTAIDAPANDR